MARLNNSLPASSPSVDSSIYRDRTPEADRAASSARRRAVRSTNIYSADASSDKENNSHHQSAKGKTAMRPPSMPTPTSDDHETPRANKRRRLQDRDASVATSTTNGERIVDLDYYDPDQKADERRELRSNMRILERDLYDRHDQLKHGNNDEIVGLVRRSNVLMDQVKQTSDATMDSRFLVAVSDLTLKKSTAMVMGANSTGIDVDEFVSRCILFMQNNGYAEEDDATATQAASTQARARRQARRADLDSDDEVEETGDAHAWDILGERACFRSNRRPPVPGFLLGPLSVQKRVRATQTQRRARLRHDRNDTKRPDVLEEKDIQRQENTNLMSIVAKIRTELEGAIEKRTDAVDNELNDLNEDPPVEVLEETMEKYGLAPSANVDQDPAMSLFEFVINPHSFGQTVENLFYTSFLIREGSIRVDKDRHGLPIVCPSKARKVNEHRAQNVSRHQAVLSIDYPTWQKFIKAYDLTEPVIAHRNEDLQPTQSARGWYG